VPDGAAEQAADQIEAQLRPDGGDLRGAGAFTGSNDGRVPGDQGDDQERHDHQDGEGEQQPAEPAQ